MHTETYEHNRKAVTDRNRQKGKLKEERVNEQWRKKLQHTHRKRRVV